MKTIGFRAAPKEVIFAVYDSDEEEILNVECIKVPLSLDLPSRLKYIRFSILDVLREYGVEKAGIRIAETVAQQSRVERVQIESIIQEVFASCDVAAYFVGGHATISRLVGFDRTLFLPYVDGTSNYEDIENWMDYNKSQREAILSAVGAANATSK